MIIGHTFQPVCQQKNSNFPQKKRSTFFVFPSKPSFLNLMILGFYSSSCKLNLIGLNISQYCGSRLPATISKIKRSFSDKGLESMVFNNLPNEQNASLMAV